MKHNIGFVHLRDTKNVGDLYSGPDRYFSFHPHKAQALCSDHLKPINHYTEHDVMVLGGGGMFVPVTIPMIEEVCCSSNKKTIIWGAGLNQKGARTDEFPPWVLDKALAMGVRDYSHSYQGYRWVPCPSCMSPAFNDVPDPTYPFVIYDHRYHTVPIGPRLAPRIDNYLHDDIESVVRFLAAGEVVLTTSYHGAYWATLLGRKVIVWPWSSKFSYMKHVPLLDWSSACADDQAVDEYLNLRSGQAKAYPEALAECRWANTDFHRHVMKLLEG